MKEKTVRTPKDYFLTESNNEKSHKQVTTFRDNVYPSSWYREYEGGYSETSARNYNTEVTHPI